MDETKIRLFLNPFLPLLISIWIALISGGCGESSKSVNKGPLGYDLNKPTVVKLPLELDEISGLAYYPKDTSLFAIVDEYGILYKVYLSRTNHIEKWPFGPDADYEDMVLLDSTFYILNSKGKIFAFKFLSEDTMGTREYPLELKGKNEFEALYYDADIRKIVMMCKDCDSDKKKSLSSYFFDPQTFQYSKGFIIDVERIAALAGEEKMKFKPSAAAIHPLTGELYIVSSINKLLVVAERDGTIKQAYELHKGLYKQPEGIAFSPNGTMFISNEAADQGVAEILIFPNNQTVNSKK